MRISLIGRAAACGLCFLSHGAAIAIDISADHCGRIVSADGRLAASFTLTRATTPAARTVTVFVCDLMYNCDTVFSAEPTTSVSMTWRDNDRLAIISSRGSLLSAGASASSGTGRPLVQIEIEAPNRAPERLRAHAGIGFDPRSCRAEPPVIATPMRRP